MKRILIFILSTLFICDLSAQSFKTLQEVSNYVTDSVKKRPDKITANTLNKAYQGVIGFLPDVVQDTASVTSPKHGYVRFQRKDSSTYIYDTIGYKRWRQYLFQAKTFAIGDSVLLHGKWVKNITTDTTLAGGDNEVPSTKAVRTALSNIVVSGGATDTTPLHNQIIQKVDDVQVTSDSVFVYKNGVQVLSFARLDPTKAITNQNASVQTGNFYINGYGRAANYRITNNPGAGIFWEGSDHSFAGDGISYTFDDILEFKSQNQIKIHAGVNNSIIFSGNSIGIYQSLGFPGLVPNYSTGGWNKVAVLNSTSNFLEFVPKDSLQAADAIRNITFVNTSPYTVTATDNYLVLNAGSGTINLPNPAAYKYRELIVNVQKFFGSQGGAISFDRYVYVANDGTVTDSTNTQPTYTTATYRSNGTKWIKVAGSYQFNIASASSVGVSMVNTSSNVGTSANGSLSVAAVKGLKAGAGIQINQIGNSDLEIVNTGIASTDSSSLYVQWPLKMLNDSTIYMSQADATHDGYLDSLDWTHFNTAYNRINPRVNAASSAATLTPDVSANDVFSVSALGVDATIAAPTGTPVAAQTLLLRIKDDGTSRTLTWNAAFRASSDFALPTSTPAGKWMYVYFTWNEVDSKYDAVGLTQGF